MISHRAKGLLRSVIYAVLPVRWVRSVRKALLPGQYREIVELVDRATYLQEDLLDDDYWSQLLRQYAHILDKGLQRPDHEQGHGLQWYRLALEALSKIQNPDILHDPSIAWAKSKLHEYELLQAGKCPSHVGFETSSGYEELLALIKKRRSARFYSEKEVGVDVIEKIIETVNWSPTSCNRQTAKVFVTNDPRLVRSCLDTCAGATNFSDFIPAFLCFCADIRSYRMPMEIFLPVLDVALGVQNSCLIAHSLGLSITLLTWAQHKPDDERRLRSALGIPSHCQIIVCGTLGYPQRGAPVPYRKSVKATYELRAL